MQSELTFYRNASAPLNGTTPSNPWQSPGTALSASGVRVYPGPTVSKALWVLVWNPNADATYNAVRLVTADSGPSNLHEIAFINRNACLQPTVNSYDITDAINAIMVGGVTKQILMQTCGDTASKVYSSTIDLIWDRDACAP